MTHKLNQFVSATLATIVLFTALVAAGPAAAHAGMGAGPLPSEVRGTYRLDSGEILTLTGTRGMPSYEVAGRRVFLRSTGEDRFAAWDNSDETLTLRRDVTGRVDGLTLAREGIQPASARKIDIYLEHDVSFRNGDVTLAGSVVLPAGSGPHPAVVIVHGAAAATRESYRLLASHFARRGVAALIYDKRGIGESTGSLSQATFDDLAGDALAGLQVLRAMATIAPDQVGMLGLSQGGWIIAMAAARSDDVAFLIPIGASGFSPAVQDRWLNGNIVAHRHLNAGVNRASEKAWRMLLSTRDLVDAGLMAPMPDVPGFWFHALDPNLEAAPLWQSVRQPLLGIWGEFDCQVPAYDSLAAVQQALDRGGQANYTLVILPRADHSITLVEPCAQETTGWSVLRFDYPDTYFGLMAEWVHEHPSSAAPMQRVVKPDPPTRSSLRWHQAPTAGVGALGSFVPQVGLMLGLLGTFAFVGLGWPVGRAVSLVRRRPGRTDKAGPLALMALVATLSAVISLVELLLLASPEGLLLVGNAPLLGASPLFVIASALIMVTLLMGSALAVRRLVGKRPAGPRLTASRGEGLVLTFVAVLAAWATYWNFVPVWSLLG